MVAADILDTAAGRVDMPAVTPVASVEAMLVDLAADMPADSVEATQVVAAMAAADTGKL